MSTHTTDRTQAATRRGLAPRVWGLAAVVVALAVLGRDEPARRVAAPEVAAPGPSSPELSPGPPASPFEVRFETLAAADGAPRALVGTLRVERDDGALVSEVEVRGSTVRVNDLPAGAYVLRVDIGGFARAARAIRTPHEPFVLSLEPIARVSGLVLGPDGLPHEATLRIVGSGIWPGREIRAEADGHFVFEDVPPGVYEVEATSADLVAEPRRGLTVEPEASLHLGLRLARGAFVEGAVVDRAGHPIAGAEIVVSTSALSASPRAATTDPSGAFRVGPFEPGVLVLDVRAAGFVQTLEHCRTTEVCRVTMSEGATLRGRVLDEEHRPIAGAWVEVLGEASDRAPISVSATVLPLASLVFGASSASASRVATPIDDALPALAAATESDLPGLGVTDQVPSIPPTPQESVAPALTVRAEVSASHIVQTSLRTDAEGSFVISGLPPGRVEVVARASGRRAARSPRLQLSAGRAREDLELVLGAGGHVQGQVRDEHGRPADARIEARIEDDPIPRDVTTDARGEFRLEDVGGAVLLLVTSEGHPPLERIVDVRGGRTEEVTISLDSGERRLRARVLDSDGVPLEDALVRLESITPGTGQPRTLVSDANGEVELSPAPPGTVSLTASHPGFSSAYTVARGEGLVSLTLGESVLVRTTLLDAWTGAGVADAEITWTCLGAPPCHRRAGSDAGGVVELPQARSGRYRVEVRARGYAPWAREVTVPTPRRGHSVEVDPLVLEPGLHVTGDVVDRFGRPVEAAEVTLEAPDARDALTSRTDARGRFELTGVPAGHRTLSIAHPSGGQATQRLEVRRDRDPAPVVIHLPERVDDDATHGDHLRRVADAGIDLEPTGSSPRIVRVSGSSARHAGLVAGDVLVAVDGQPVTSPEQAQPRLTGSTTIPALLEVRRGGATFFVRIAREPR